MKTARNLIENTILILAIIMLFVMVGTYWGCKPDPVEQPVPIVEYVEVSLTNGLENHPLLAYDGSARLYQSSVDWNHDDFVDESQEVEVWFNAGASNTGETVSFNSTWGGLRTATFRVKAGTYAQIHVTPKDTTVANPTYARNDSHVQFRAATTSLVTITSSTGIIMLKAHTNYHVVIIADADGSMENSYPVSITTSDGTVVPCHYFYNSGYPGYSFSVTDANGDTYTETVDNVIPAEILVCIPGVGVGIGIEW